MTELDSLFGLAEGDLDSLDKNVHQKYAFVPPLAAINHRLTRNTVGSRLSPQKHRSSRPWKHGYAKPKNG